MKEAILEKLAEVEAMLLEASCEGEQLAELECFDEVQSALGNLTEAVGYYVD